MARIVQKFGGTSVATLERIKNVANIIAASYKNGRNVVAVVSAMAGVTNKFIGYVHNLNIREGDPEYDQVVSSGELVSAGLLALALKKLGFKANSYASWQVPIFTDDSYGQAIIQKVDTSNLEKDITAGVIPVVCGFQGVSPENRVTTLGRGGSDLTAVAIASAIGANLCEIYSDVDGVYTVDPNLYGEARRIDAINYHEMLEMASQGAKILQEQSVAYAMKKNIAIRVASSFVNGEGTIISARTPSKNFLGLAVTPSLAQVRIAHNKDINSVINILKKRLINAEIMGQEEPSRLDILLDKKKIMIALDTLKNCSFVKNVRQVMMRRPSSLISVIGSSASNETGEALIATLKNKKMEVLGFSATNYKVNLIVSSGTLPEAIALLHKYCGLGK